MSGLNDDYRYSEDARERDLCIAWKCNRCGREREESPGCNEGGSCECGGQFNEAGETYSVSAGGDG